MEKVLTVLLVIYACVLIVNSIITYVMYRIQKHEFFLYACLSWVFTAINFLLQGVFQEPSVWMLLAFVSYAPCGLFLTHIMVLSAQQRMNWKRCIAFQLTLIALSLITYQLTHHFQLAAILMSIAIAAPMLRYSWMVFQYREHLKPVVQFYALLLTLSAIHFLDYPFLRVIPMGAVFGFSLALMLVFAFSIFLPAFIVHQLKAQYAHDLNLQVRLRTAELMQKNDELEALTIENKNLLNIVSHDLATPLSVLQLATKKIFKTVDASAISADFTKYQQRIEKSIVVIHEILDKVRRIQALKTGKFQLDIGSVDLQNLVKESLYLFEEKLDQKRISVNVIHHLPENVKVMADAVVLKNQVINNLISNAIKFSEVGSKIILLLELQNDDVVLEIRDQGMGIPEHLLNQIFDDSKPTTREGTSGESGTGFGLPLVKACLEKFGAHIHVESRVKQQNSTELDHGSVFHIKFKRAA